MSAIEETNIPANTIVKEPIDVDASMVEPEGNASLSTVEAEVCVAKAYGRKPKSVVWSHFSKITEKGSKKAKGAVYNHCKKPYAWASENGTSSLKKHMLKCTKNPHNKEVRRQKTLASYGSTKGESESALGLWKFDQNACRDALARMIIKDELPFKFVEREGFRYFCSVTQPNFKKVSRNTAARECVALYSNEKKKLRNLFKKSSQRLCLTTNTWTSLQNVSYMVLTAHFIDNDWKLHKRVLNFCVISSHKGEAIGKALEACLLEWGVERLCTLTVDNASANDVAVAYLKRKFSKKSDTFILGGQFFHICSFAFILEFNSYLKLCKKLLSMGSPSKSALLV